MLQSSQTIIKASGAVSSGLFGGQVKGKQVKVLYDLVTVSGEQKARCVHAVTGKPGRRLLCEDPRVRKPAGCWYGNENSGSRGIDCTVFIIPRRREKKDSHAEVWGVFLVYLTF